MDTYEKDYRYLLLNLIPQHRLSPALRREVEQALQSGAPEDLRRQSVLALEELCTSHYLERVGLRRSNGDVIADYKRKGGRYSMSVALPVEEWAQYVSAPLPERRSAAGDATARSERDRAGTSLDRPFPAAGPDAPDVEVLNYLPEITGVFSVSGRADPVLGRLELLLRTVERWLGAGGLRLLLLEEVAGLGGVETERLRTMTDAHLREIDLYRRCIESGVQRWLPHREASGPVVDDAPRDWDYVGAAPVFAMGKVCGVLVMYFDARVDETTRKRRLEAVSHLVRQALEFNSQIETITSVDALTQIYNRHFYDVQVSVEIERAMRSGNEVSMLVIDLDDFKLVNDEMGHKKGDEALKAVADLIRKNLRKVDLPFRYGGEEFVILLPGTSEFESVHTAERLRRVIAEHKGFKDFLGRPRIVTVSIGVSVFPDTASSADELFNQADAAMYRAKQMGKNRVVLYKHGMNLGQA